MKLNRRSILAVFAMMLAVALLMPCLVSCAGEEAAKTDAPASEETASAPANTAPEAPEQTATAGGSSTPGSDYIPPENYINYENAPALQTTPNSGGAGSMVVAGGAGGLSDAGLAEAIGKNPALAGTPATRRAAAEGAMRKMLTVLWTPALDTTYSYNAAAYSDADTVDETEFAKNQITLKKGKIYQGLPYTLGSASLEAFLYGTTYSGGVYTKALTSKMLSGSSTVSARLGVDDVDALAWAWAAVSPSAKFISTETMVARNGVVFLGDLVLPAEAAESLDGLTDDIIVANGEKALLEAYAKLQKADGLVSDTGADGHAMMVVSVSISYNPDGSINPDLSYVTLLEQTDANLVAFEALSDTEKAAVASKTLVIGGVDVKYSFRELIDGAFVPVSCEELELTGALEPVYQGDSYRSNFEYTKYHIYAGTIQANRRFVSLNQVIVDADGNEVINTTLIPTEASVGGNTFSFAMSAWNAASEATRCYGSPTLTALAKGKTYTLTLTARLATGETVTYRNYSFTY